MSSSSSDFSENNSQEFEKEDLEEDDEFQPKIFRTTLPKPTSNPLGTGFIPKQSTTLDKDFAKFDKGGKLLRMMEKMGYKKGMGIGKQEDGIAVPVEVVVRAAGVGIGFDKNDKIKKPPDLQKNKQSIQQPQQGWKASTKKRRMPPTAYEIIHEEMDHHKPSRDKVHSIRDMTGSEEKVLTDFSNLSSSQQQKDTKRLPELRHNINLITNLAKTDLTYLAKQLSLEEDCQIRRKDDIEKTVELIQRDKEELGLVQDYLSISKSIATLLKTHSDDISNPSIPPETCYIHFKPQIESLPETHHLQSLKYNLFTRLIQPRVQGWSALETPAYFSTILLQAHKSLGDLTPWLIYSQILPPIRSVILTYDIHNPEGLITLLEIYKPYCDWVWKNITNLILPRLQVIIEEYDFKRDWRIQYCLIPFMNVIGVETLMSRVRERLSVHVQNTPLLAREVYEYWKEVWDESDLDKFVERGVLPTLIEFMQREVQVDPSNQDLQPLEKVLEWHGRIKDHLLSNLLVTEFFSKWNQVLKLWISNSLVDLDEISGWYTAWKGFFDQKGVSYLLGVKEAFKNGLDLINQGLSGNLRGISKIKVKSRVSKVVKTLNTAQMSFKELVELECGERSIEFVPLQKRNVEGKEVYRMGKLKVYIDDGVLFVNVGGEYKYMGIEEAMSKATE